MGGKKGSTKLFLASPEAQTDWKRGFFYTRFKKSWIFSAAAEQKNIVSEVGAQAVMLIHELLH